MTGSQKSSDPIDRAHNRYRDIVDRGGVNIFLYGTGDYFNEIGYHLHMFPSGMAEANMNEMPGRVNDFETT